MAAVAAVLTGLPTQPKLGGAGRWLFCSQAALAETRRSTDLELSDYGILPAGVEHEYLEVPREPAPPPWRWRLLYVGRIVEQKGIHTAIEALARLPHQAELRIVGEGDPPYRHRLEELAGECGVADRVLFESPRPREELLDVYRACDAVLFPVEWAEPWGLVPLEAMALGRPVIATGRGGSGDYLRHETNCLLFPAGDAALLAASVLALANDSELRARLADGGYATARGHSERDFNDGAVQEIERIAAVANDAR